MAFASDAVGAPNERDQTLRYELYYRSSLLGNLETLRQATSGAAELLNMSGMMNPYPGKLGVIQEGAYADILLVDGNPLKDISVLWSIR